MFKVGDKLICKIDYFDMAKRKMFIKGHEYNITHIDDGDGIYCINLINIGVGIKNETFLYFMGMSKFYKYFYNNREIRKLKLEKLENV